MLFWKETSDCGIRYTPVVSFAEHPHLMEYELRLADGKTIIYNKVPNDEQTKFFLTAMVNNSPHII